MKKMGRRTLALGMTALTVFSIMRVDGILSVAQAGTVVPALTRVNPEAYDPSRSNANRVARGDWRGKVGGSAHSRPEHHVEVAKVQGETHSLDHNYLELLGREDQFIGLTQADRATLEQGLGTAIDTLDQERPSILITDRSDEDGQRLVNLYVNQIAYEDQIRTEITQALADARREGISGSIKSPDLIALVRKLRKGPATTLPQRTQASVRNLLSRQ